MKKAITIISTAVLSIALLALFGCGGAKVEAKAGGADNKGDSPYGATSLKGGEGSEGATKLSEEDEQLIIPGSQFGKAPPVKKAGKAKKGKKGKKGDSAPQTVPYTEAIAEQMEGLEWGMTYKKVISVFEEQVRARYAEELAGAAGDALAEDQVRTKIRRDISRLRKSYVEFEGQTTGFEGHMIADEFSHNNGESMLMWDAGKYVEYLFFFNGRFWKRLRAFRIDSFASKIDFMTFLTTLENRFGEGMPTFNDQGELDNVKWRDETTYVAALDRSGFFGAFGLRFSAAVTETYLDDLRPNKGKSDGSVGDDISSMVDAVTTSEGKLADHESSVIDSYTGGEASGVGTIDTTHSVTASQKKKEKKKEEKKEEKAEEAPPAKKEEKPDKDFIDDLF